MTSVLFMEVSSIQAWGPVYMQAFVMVHLDASLRTCTLIAWKGTGTFCEPVKRVSVN